MRIGRVCGIARTQTQRQAPPFCFRWHPLGHLDCFCSNPTPPSLCSCSSLRTHPAHSTTLRSSKMQQLTLQRRLGHHERLRRQGQEDQDQTQEEKGRPPCCARHGACVEAGDEGKERLSVPVGCGSEEKKKVN